MQSLTSYEEQRHANLELILNQNTNMVITRVS